jgi:hypothetical protein
MAYTVSVDQTLKMYIENNAVNFTNGSYGLPKPCVITGKNGCGKSTFLKNATDHLFSQLVNKKMINLSMTEELISEVLNKNHPIFLRFDREEINFLNSADIKEITKVQDSDEFSEYNHRMQISKLPDMIKYQNTINHFKNFLSNSKDPKKEEMKNYLISIKQIFNYLCYVGENAELEGYKITPKDNSECQFQKNNQDISSNDLSLADLFYLINKLVTHLKSERFLRLSLYINGMSAHDFMSIENILKYIYLIKSDMINEINDHLSNNALQLKPGFKLIQTPKNHDISSGNFFC